MDVWNLAKGLGVVIVGAIAFSANSAIAKINQGVTLENNLNAPTKGYDADIISLIDYS
ncbi:MAG: hypothetical protein ACYTXI_42400 [Nostoc sp.]